MKHKSLNIADDNDTWFIVLVAVRYCMGRMSYAPSLVQEWVRRNWAVIPKSTRSMLIRDVSMEIVSCESNDRLLGDKHDHECWKTFLSWMIYEDSK